MVAMGAAGCQSQTRPHANAPDVKPIVGGDFPSGLGVQSARTDYGQVLGSAAGCWADSIDIRVLPDPHTRAGTSA